MNRDKLSLDLFSMQEQKLPIIGSLEPVDVCGRESVPAKIDTGADSSAIWASDIEIAKSGVLKFKLFGEGSPYYDGEVIERKDYKVAVVRSATGQEQIRYRTHFTVRIAGKNIRMLLNLSDRSNNNFPVLIGRRSISRKFLVDVSKKAIPQPPKNPKTKPLQKELEKNPYKFHQKYVKLTKKGAEK